MWWAFSLGLLVGALGVVVIEGALIAKAILGYSKTDPSVQNRVSKTPTRSTEPFAWVDTTTPSRPH